MTSRWMFFPSPAATGVKLQLDGELVATNRANHFSLANATLSGSDDVSNNYELYPHSPLRKNNGSTYIEWIFKVISSGDYSSAGDWETAVTNAGGADLSASDWTHDGSVFPAASINYTAGSDGGLVVRVRWYGSNTDVTSFWNTLSAGDSTQIKLNW